MKHANLIRDIRKHLKKNRTIKGFTRHRLEEVLTEESLELYSYEWRILIAWSGLYVYQFGEKYKVKIETE